MFKLYNIKGENYVINYWSYFFKGLSQKQTVILLLGFNSKLEGVACFKKIV